MKAIWNWIVERRRTLGKAGLAYLALELVFALAAVLGLRMWL